MRFDFGGRYVPELLIAPLDALQKGWNDIGRSPPFQERLKELLRRYAGRPTPLTRASRLGAMVGVERLYLKREDLLHTGAHKLNNALGQVLLAIEMGKRRIIAETGAGQHGVAAATACAHLGVECVVYMGQRDAERQLVNVQRMELLGAQVVRVSEGAGTLKAAVNGALRDWAESFEETHYCLGSAVGPRPFPQIVQAFQSVIGEEIQGEIGRPDLVIACVGGGSNALGAFAPFIAEPEVRLVAVEAEGARSMGGGSPGVLHGAYTLLLQSEGQMAPTHSIAAGLDYPGVSPELAALARVGRVELAAVDDEGAVEAYRLLARTEGILPALESSHAVAHLLRMELPRECCVVVNISGRGDKDMESVLCRG